MARLALTFDNGPDGETTPAVLDVLARRGVPATFFLVARRLDDPAARAAATRARAEGHRIGNHTLTHSVCFGDDPDPAVAAREIGEAEARIGALAMPERLFRPYAAGGILDRRVFSAAARTWLRDGGYTCVLWNVVPRDWEDHDGWPGRTLAALGTIDDAVVVVHDVVAPAMRRLDAFLGQAADAGHTVVADFAPGCVPIRAGREVAALDHLTGAG